MVNVDRILKNRNFSKKGNLLKIFEKKISDAWELERECFMRKFPRRNQYQSRIQYVVFLVSCLEFFLEEMFKQAVDKKIVSLAKLKKFKKFKQTKFNLRELEKINENKIKLSEILAEEMNFQNMRDIMVLFKCLDLDDNYKSLPKKDKNFNLLGMEKGDSKEVSEKKIKKNILKYIVGEMGEIPEKNEDFLRMFGTVRKMILIRHQIIHKAQVIKIENWESWAYSMATAKIGYLLNALYNLKKRDKKLK